jgi:hypothetical protein
MSRGSAICARRRTPALARLGRPVAHGGIVIALGFLACGCQSNTPRHPPTPKAAAIGAVGQPAPQPGELTGLTCPDAKHCWAVGVAPAQPVALTRSPQNAVVDVTDDGGTTWRAQSVPLSGPSALSSISCADFLHCMAVGAVTQPSGLGVVVETDDGGARWVQENAPTSSIDVTGVSCSADDDCIVMASDGTTLFSATTEDGGTVWQRNGNLPTGFTGPGDIDCAVPSVCEVAGYLPSTPGHGTGAIATTSNGGASWSLATVPSGIGLLHAVTCSANDACLAVGTTSTTASDVALGHALVLSTDDRLNWVLEHEPSSIDDIFGASCDDEYACAVVGTVWVPSAPPTPTVGIATTTSGGFSWTKPTTLYLPTGLDAVDCLSPTTCLAAGGNVLARITLTTNRAG